MTNPLENIPSKDLEKELRRRVHQEWQDRQILRDRIAQRSLVNIDTLLSAVPMHDRTSCSDQNVCNGEIYGERSAPRCIRCFLLDTKKMNWWDPTVQLTLHVEKFNDPEPPKP